MHWEWVGLVGLGEWLGKRLVVGLKTGGMTVRTWLDG